MSISLSEPHEAKYPISTILYSGLHDLKNSSISLNTGQTNNLNLEYSLQTEKFKSPLFETFATCNYQSESNNHPIYKGSTNLDFPINDKLEHEHKRSAYFDTKKTDRYDLLPNNGYYDNTSSLIPTNTDYGYTPIKPRDSESNLKKVNQNEQFITINPPISTANLGLTTLLPTNDLGYMSDNYQIVSPTNLIQQQGINNDFKYQDMKMNTAQKNSNINSLRIAHIPKSSISTPRNVKNETSSRVKLPLNSIKTNDLSSHLDTQNPREFVNNDYLMPSCERNLGTTPNILNNQAEIKQNLQNKDQILAQDVSQNRQDVFIEDSKVQTAELNLDDKLLSNIKSGFFPETSTKHGILDSNFLEKLGSPNLNPHIKEKCQENNIEANKTTQIFEQYGRSTNFINQSNSITQDENSNSQFIGKTTYQPLNIGHLKSTTGKIYSTEDNVMGNTNDKLHDTNLNGSSSSKLEYFSTIYAKERPTIIIDSHAQEGQEPHLKAKEINSSSKKNHNYLDSNADDSQLPFIELKKSNADSTNVNDILSMQGATQDPSNIFNTYLNQNSGISGSPKQWINEKSILMQIDNEKVKNSPSPKAYSDSEKIYNLEFHNAQPKNQANLTNIKINEFTQEIDKQKDVNDEEKDKIINPIEQQLYLPTNPKNDSQDLKKDSDKKEETIEKTDTKVTEDQIDNNPTNFHNQNKLIKDGATQKISKILKQPSKNFWRLPKDKKVSIIRSHSIKSNGKIGIRANDDIFPQGFSPILTPISSIQNVDDGLEIMQFDMNLSREEEQRNFITKTYSMNSLQRALNDSITHSEGMSQMISSIRRTDDNFDGFSEEKIEWVNFNQKKTLDFKKKGCSENKSISITPITYSKNNNLEDLNKKNSNDKISKKNYSPNLHTATIRDKNICESIRPAKNVEDNRIKINKNISIRDKRKQQNFKRFDIDHNSDVIDLKVGCYMGKKFGQVSPSSAKDFSSFIFSNKYDDKFYDSSDSNFLTKFEEDLDDELFNNGGIAETIRNKKEKIFKQMSKIDKQLEELKPDSKNKNTMSNPIVNKIEVPSLNKHKSNINSKSSSTQRIFLDMKQLKSFSLKSNENIAKEAAKSNDDFPNTKKVVQKEESNVENIVHETNKIGCRNESLLKTSVDIVKSDINNINEFYKILYGQKMPMSMKQNDSHKFKQKITKFFSKLCEKNEKICKDSVPQSTYLDVVSNKINSKKVNSKSPENKAKSIIVTTSNNQQNYLIPKYGKDKRSLDKENTDKNLIRHSTETNNKPEGFISKTKQINTMQDQIKVSKVVNNISKAENHKINQNQSGKPANANDQEKNIAGNNLLKIAKPAIVNCTSVCTVEKQKHHLNGMKGSCLSNSPQRLKNYESSDPPQDSCPRVKSPSLSRDKKRSSAKKDCEKENFTMINSKENLKVNSLPTKVFKTQECKQTKSILVKHQDHDKIKEHKTNLTFRPKTNSISPAREFKSEEFYEKNVKLMKDIRNKTQLKQNKIIKSAKSPTYNQKILIRDSITAPRTRSAFSNERLHSQPKMTQIDCYINIEEYPIKIENRSSSVRQSYKKDIKETFNLLQNLNNFFGKKTNMKSEKNEFASKQSTTFF